MVGVKPFSDHDLNTANKLGELHADMRAVKHDVVNLSGKLDAFSAQMTAHVAALTVSINSVNTKQERGLGFFAGVTFVIGGAAALFAMFAKVVLGIGGHGT